MSVGLLHGYHANRTLALLALVLAAGYALLWDLRGADAWVPLTWLAAQAEALDLGWLAAFIGRIVGEWFMTGMLSLLILLVVYALLQLLGVRHDRACLLRGGWRRAGLAAPLTGRPAGLCEALAAGVAGDLHFGFGRWHLLEPLRLGLWAFPVLGFLGTVLGVSQAVKDLPGAMKDDAALSAVLTSLHLAFDTTFLGLVASLVLMLLLYVLDSEWTRNEVLAERLAALPAAVERAADGGQGPPASGGEAGGPAAADPPAVPATGAAEP